MSFLFVILSLTNQLKNTKCVFGLDYHTFLKAWRVWTGYAICCFNIKSFTEPDPLPFIPLRGIVQFKLQKESRTYCDCLSEFSSQVTLYQTRFTNIGIAQNDHFDITERKE